MENEIKVTTFKERLRLACRESGRSDTEIARGIKVSKQTLSAWKTGERSPKEPTIIAVAQYFGVSVAWMMGFDGPKYATDMKREERFMEPLTPEQQLRSDFHELVDTASPELLAQLRTYAEFLRSRQQGTAEPDNQANQ